MARTRAQGKKPQGVQKSVNTRRAHLQQRVPLEPSNLHQQPSLPTKVTPLPVCRPQRNMVPQTKTLKDSRPSDQRTKRGIGLDHDSEPPQKRPRRSLRLNPTTPTKRGAKRNVETLDSDTPQKPSRRSPIQPATAGTADRPTDPIEFWAKETVWPQEYLNPSVAHILARKRSQRSLSRKRSNSGTSTSTTPSDQRPREEKSTPYRDPRYKTLLATKNSFMEESDLGISKGSKDTCISFLSSDQTLPDNTLFHDTVFKQTCQRVEDRNEARVIRDISPLIVPSAEILCIYGDQSLNILIESTNEGWNNSIPLTGTRPQPDFSVGFRRESFTEVQLLKLSPFIGDFIAGDVSYFMATYYMYFPFLTCEVKCGATGLDVADRQNAHSMTLAVRAVVELFRAVKREKELHRQILGFSVSHDHRSIRIYGHYPVLDEMTADTKYYRHLIHEFSFTTLDGKERWTAYRFTKSIYNSWMPNHFKRICSAIDQLPSDWDFDDVSLTGTGLSQSLRSHHLAQSAELDSISVSVDGESSDALQKVDTPATSHADPGAVKRRKGRKRAT